MDINVIICPNCGAKIKIKPNTDYAICEYCDSQVLVNDGHEKVEYIDQARIKEAELESKRLDELRWEKEKELEELHRWQRIRNAWFAIIIILLCVMVLSESFEMISTISSRLMVCVLLSGFIVWGIKPKTSSGISPKEEIKQVPNTSRQNNEFEQRNPYYDPNLRRDPRFDPIDIRTQIPEKKLPWYIRTGWIITIGFFTEGIYWIIGPILRIWWKNRH